MDNVDKRVAELEREKRELGDSLKIAHRENARLSDENIQLKRDLKVRDEEAKNLKNTICGFEHMQVNMAREYGEMKASNYEKDLIIAEKEAENRNLRFDREIGTVVAHAESVNIYQSKDDDKKCKL